MAGADRNFTVSHFSLIPQHHQAAAEWNVEAWKHLYPQDTTQTYFDMFYHTGEWGSGKLVEWYGAVSNEDELLGIAGVLADDKPPDAPEPGPWLAAVWVKPSARNIGVGSTLVQHAIQRGKINGFGEHLYLFTEDMHAFYRKRGWEPVRQAPYHGGLTVHVMRMALR